MKNKLSKYFAVIASTLLLACGGDDPGSPEPGDSEDAPTSSTRVERASLEAAVPANGELVRGGFFLGAIVDSSEPVEVRFFIDAVEVAVVNELPYQVRMSACDLTAGNHAYSVEIEDQNGQRDHVQHFFEASCD